MTAAGPDEGRYEFRILSTSEIYRGNIFALRADEVAMPGGGSARREVVEHFGAVSVAALDESHRITLIHQYRHPLGRRLWELPAGLLDAAGEDPVDTARRELAEEVGLAARQWSVLADTAASPGMTDEALRIFLAQDLSDVGRDSDTGDEEADLRIQRFPIDEAVAMVFSGEIVNGSTVSGILATKLVLEGVARPRPVGAPWADRPSKFAAGRP